MPERNAGDAWDGDYDLAQSQFREIFAIEGFRLRKPVPVAFYEQEARDVSPRFTITHRLPSLDGRGYLIEGHGDTAEEANEAFLELLTGLHSDLTDLTDAELGEETRLQRDYLNSIMCKEEPTSQANAPKRVGQMLKHQESYCRGESNSKPALGHDPSVE